MKCTMKVHAIARDDYKGGPSSYQRSWAYSALFHGDAGISNLYGERPYRPMTLTLNRQLLPPLIIPSIQMVVNNSISDNLKELHACDLCRCVWDGMYDHPADEPHIEELLSKFSPITGEFEDWLEKQKRQPDAETQKLEYFEVIAPLLNKVSTKFTCNQQIDLPSPIYITMEPAQTCREVHEQFPLVKMTPYYLCVDKVYDILKPYISNALLFRVHSFDVN